MMSRARGIGYTRDNSWYRRLARDCRIGLGWLALLRLLTDDELFRIYVTEDEDTEQKQQENEEK